MKIRPVLALPVLAAVLAFAPSASAQELGIAFKKKHVSIGLTVGDRCTPMHSAPVCYSPRPIAYERREWGPSHYETITEQVFVPGRQEQFYVPAVYEWRTDHCGRSFQVVVCPAHHETRCTPGHYETVTRQIWVEGGWRVRQCR